MGKALSYAIYKYANVYTEVDCLLRYANFNIDTFTYDDNSLIGFKLVGTAEDKDIADGLRSRIAIVMGNNGIIPYPPMELQGNVKALILWACEHVPF